MNPAILNRVAVFWVSILVVVSLQPWRPVHRHAGVLHDVPHFLAYFSTVLLLLLIARTTWQRICAPLAVVALGVAIEYAQHLLYRGRFEWRDLASDACAAFLCVLCASVVKVQ